MVPNFQIIEIAVKIRMSVSITEVSLGLKSGNISQYLGAGHFIWSACGETKSPFLEKHR